MNQRKQRMRAHSQSEGTRPEVRRSWNQTSQQHSQTLEDEVVETVLVSAAGLFGLVPLAWPIPVTKDKRGCAQLRILDP